MTVVPVVKPVTFYSCFDAFVIFFSTQIHLLDDRFCTCSSPIVKRNLDLENERCLNVFVAFAMPTSVMETFGTRYKYVTNTLDIWDCLYVFVT